MQPSLRLNDRCCEIHTAISERVEVSLCHYRGVTTTKAERTRPKVHIHIYPGPCRLTGLENRRERAFALHLVEKFPLLLCLPPHLFDRVDNKVVPPAGVERGVHLFSLGASSPDRRDAASTTEAWGQRMPDEICVACDIRKHLCLVC